MKKLLPGLSMWLLLPWLVLGGEPAEPTGSGDWPQFLGPHRNGVSPEAGLNLDWDSERPQIVWKVKAGAGYSSMTVARHRVFMGAQRNGTDLILCCRRCRRVSWAYGPCVMPIALDLCCCVSTTRWAPSINAYSAPHR